MHAITVDDDGAMTWSDVPDPQPQPGEVLIDVKAAGVNRADLLQAQGSYPPPTGASPYLGLEVSGRISALGDGVAGLGVGVEVCALLAGGGYAEQVAVPAGQVLPIPVGVPKLDAAAVPETTATVWSTVFMWARLHPGETVLVHGGASGIGTTAIQLAARHGARVITTAGSETKLRRCRDLGADVAINYKTEDFAGRVQAETGGRGADVVLDIVGAAYLDRNVRSLALDGRLVVLGMQAGRKGELDLGALMAKRGTVHAAGLRTRSIEAKAEILSAVHDNVWPAFADGQLQVVVDRRIPIERVAEAHRLLESGAVIGKIVLTMPA